MIRTAEFVSPKHPDKICDIISDTLLDEYLKNDSESRCAIETCGGHGKIMVVGEVTSKTMLSKETIKNIIENISNINDVTINIVQQSPEISRGVDIGGAGDQGIMVGYACRENEEYLPQEYYLARKLNKDIYSIYPYDGKTQVTLEDNNVIVVSSFQNVKSEDLKNIIYDFFETHYPYYNIKKVLCNPAGDWYTGGFEADAGVTGRKIVVDNYGPRVPVGGGAFSGKDANSKVDRSAAYMARYIAVNYLENNPQYEEAIVNISYAIGFDKPLQYTITLDGEIKKLDLDIWDLSPLGISKFLDLKRPIYAETAKWGHMGNGFNWK